LHAVVKLAHGWRRAIALFDCGNDDGTKARAKAGALRMLKASLIGLFVLRQPADRMTPAKDGDGRTAWIAGWTLAALILIAGSGMAALHQDFSEPDNAMRLVRVRDMLAGQGWFDSVQHRLNPPEGTPMHWAQWIDATIAAPIRVLTPLIGQQSAEVAMAFVWPLGLLAVFMALVVRISGEIGAYDGLRSEAQWTGAIIAALAFPAIEKFSPASFDHHNVEIVLALVAIISLMKMKDHPRSGLWAGAALGVALATAAEAAPLVVAGAAVAGVLWLLRPAEFAKGLGWLGAGLSASSAVMFVALVPPAGWWKPVCDAMGAPFLGFGLIGGGIAIALAHAPASATSTLVRRSGLTGGLGVVGVAALVLLFPQCAGGGYAALSADMEDLWMHQISETRSLADLLGDDPAMILNMAGAALAGLVASVIFLRRHWRDANGWIALAFLLSGWAVLCWQIRGATFATAFAIPFGAWAVAKARRDYRNRTSAIRALAFAGVAVSSAAAAWASVGETLQAKFTPQDVMANYHARAANAEICFTPEAYRSLRAAKAGVMLNQFALGAGVLIWTDHSVLAGPYHRDISGVMTVIDALRSSPEKARAVVTRSAADYVVVCPAAPETSYYAHHAADGVAREATLSAMLGRGEHPDWLSPVDIGDSPLRLYRIVR
jgi:hypothetical protein